jgi:hypothetical protein
LSVLFAATYPSRTQALIVYSGLGFPRKLNQTDKEWEEVVRHTHETWGTIEAAREDLAPLAPSIANDAQWLEFLCRLGSCISESRRISSARTNEP